jgi:protein gp37
MAHTSNIEWTEATWNPWHGCHKVSQGCKNCYMFRDKERYGQDPNIVVRSKTKFYDPLKWSEPRTIFTCSWSDFFIEEADAWRDEAFAIMALTPQHTFQILTKRPERMLEYLSVPGHIANAAIELRKERGITFPNAEFNTEPLGYGDPGAEWFPLRNVWLGVSVEDQKTADERIPLLLKTPAAVRWLSMEPLLGPVDLSWNYRSTVSPIRAHPTIDHKYLDKLDWVVVGGESGPDARPMHGQWAIDIQEQCSAAGVPFFFKQWGEWVPRGQAAERGLDSSSEIELHDPYKTFMSRVGKKNAGRLLKGQEWNEFPGGHLG